MKKVLLLIACVMAFSSCTFGEWSLAPSENIVTKDYQLSSFEEIAMHCVGNVEVIQDKAKNGLVQLTAPDNFVEYITFESKNSRLDIRSTLKRLNMDGGQIKIKVYTTDLIKLTNSGVSRIAMDSLDTDKLEITNSGVGEIAVSGIADDVELRNAIRQSLATERGWNAHEKDSCDWEVAVFDGMPVGASITILTKMQNDVRTTESQLIQYLMDRTDAGDLRVNKLNAYVIPNSNYVIRGGKYSAQIILAAVDSTQRPEYYIEGQRINDQGIYEVAASGVGLKKYSGWIAYQNPSTGAMENLPFSSEYSVGEPAVTISNTDLNIMYRGYDNKFSISVPGVANDKVKVNVNGATVRQQGGLWIIKPGDNTKSVTISVSAELDGRMQSMGSRDYRVKALPKPGAYFKSGEKEYNEGSISRGALLNSSATVIASYGPDGLLDLPYDITSFKVNINGVFTEARGNKFTRDQMDRLGKLKMGAIVVITDVRAKGPDGKETRLAPIPLYLN